MTKPPTVDRVRELFSYDHETGLLRWRRVHRLAHLEGRIAGRLCSKGYRRVALDKRTFTAHRLVWLHVYGYWPESIVDHINGDKLDNRVANLRLATNAENCRNRGAQSNNTSGHKGVGWHKRDRKWQAYIAVDGRQKCLGNFDTLDDAAAAYRAAATIMHAEFARF